mgnify:CR=1 FL=1
MSGRRRGETDGVRAAGSEAGDVVLIGQAARPVRRRALGDQRCARVCALGSCHHHSAFADEWQTRERGQGVGQHRFGRFAVGDGDEDRGGTDFGRDILPFMCDSARVFAYDFAQNTVPGVQEFEEPAAMRARTSDAPAAVQRSASSVLWRWYSGPSFSPTSASQAPRFGGNGA